MSHKKRAKNNSELINSLNTSLNLLKTFSKNFDIGDISMALPMATQARVLLHQTSKSQSLFHQLSLDNIIKMWDSSQSSFTPANLLTSFSLLKVSINGKDKNEYLPLGSRNQFNKNIDMDGNIIPEFFFPLENWWNMIVFSDNNIHLTRRDIIIYIANKDGGTHVDKYIYDTDDFKNASILRWLDQFENAPSGNPLYLTMRQIIEEILISYEVHNTSYNSILPAYKGKIQFRKLEADNPAIYSTFIVNPDGSQNDTSSVSSNLIFQTSPWKLKHFNKPNWTFIDDDEFNNTIEILEV